MKNVDLELLYQDDRLAAINKPSGLLTHRSEMAGDRRNCMTMLRDRLGRRVYPVHRLDRGTSGALLFALDAETAAELAGLFAGRAVDKQYLAIVRGYAPDEGVIDYPLGGQTDVTPVEAVTEFRRLDRVELPHAVGRYPTSRYSLALAEPRTGRWHQIRRHMAHIHHPVVGDTVHGEGRHNRFFREQYGLHRLALHAVGIRFTHPWTGSQTHITAPLPTELRDLFATFGWSAEFPDRLRRENDR